MIATNTVLVPASKYSCVCKRTQKISLAVGQNLDYHILYKPKHKAFYKESLNAEDDTDAFISGPSRRGCGRVGEIHGGTAICSIKNTLLGNHLESTPINQFEFMITLCKRAVEDET